jgi:ABC-type transport system involved in multi-copper enzyme maturation permease subunit
MFKQLLWKEWRENLWKLTFGGAVSAAFVLLLFRIRLFPDAANCVAISFVQMLALPVIYALDIFSGEMSSRTIHLLFKFPVPRWKIFFSKYLISVGGILAVFLISGLLMELIAQGRETEARFLFKMNASFGISALLLFTWFCAFDVQNRSEGESLIAIVVVSKCWMKSRYQRALHILAVFKNTIILFDWAIVLRSRHLMTK